MPCLVVLLALIAPRVVSFLLWLFTPFFDAAFSTRPLFLLLGVVFMPFTTLAYAWAVNHEGGVHSTFAIVVMVVAVIVDFSSFEGGRRSRRR